MKIDQWDNYTVTHVRELNLTLTDTGIVWRSFRIFAEIQTELTFGLCYWLWTPEAASTPTVWNTWCILPLLDCISRAHGMGVCPSVVSKKFQNATAATNCAKKVSNFSWNFSSMALTKLRLEFLKFRKIENLTIFFYFILVNRGYNGSKIVETLLLPQNRSQRFSNLSWIFLPVVLTKLRWGFLKFWVSDFYRYLFFKNF